MEKITTIFILTAILNFVKMDTYDVYDDYDVQFELRSVLAKMKSFSIDMQRLQRKQSAMERRFRKFPTDINAECCKERSKDILHTQNIQNASRIANILAIKKAFSTEKKHLRTMIHSWEKTMEAKVFHNKIQKEKNIEIKDIEEKLSGQESITSKLSLQLENFKETIDVVSNLSEERHETLGKKLSTIEVKSDSIEERIDLMGSSISSLILSSDKKVSFSVQYQPKEGSVATLYKKLKPIIFKDVIYNEGEGYNETTGIFTVPVAGVYQFIFFVEGWHQGNTFTCQDAIVALYIDGKAKAAAVADPRHDKQFATGGNTYINYLSKGQKLQIGTAKTCEQYIIFGYRTSFSGHLLY